ncbi:MAG: primosomal protein N', partial [Planctomycetaceae bacterium]|nr:primosomal protein N' [Planctomycetaceae bacterium]
VPRYHAREVARKRAELDRVPLVLGSATPMLESWWQTKQGKATLISMPERIEKLPMPPVVIVDTINDPLIRHGHNIGRALKTGIDQALRQDGQVILFYNLRGFTPVLWCRACGEKLSCPHCTTTLTWHKDKRLCLCHTCDYSSPLPAQCPSCKKPGLKHFGSGTQKLEEEVRLKFPGVSVVRMDSDSMRKHGSHDEALERFRHGDVRILLGTQMIAKGLDFPNVTLVGVVDADTALHQVDFRASERTFQLISQVAGRTGRSQRGGRVLVQTMQPDAEAIRFAAEHDYIGFATQELSHREERLMPPQSVLLRLILRGKDEAILDAEAVKMSDLLREAANELQLTCRILGPAPAPLARHKDFFRYQILISSRTHEILTGLVRHCESAFEKLTGIEYAIDVDPLHMR